MSCFLMVVVIWVFSVCLHEFGHAWVALQGGDYTVRDKGYLSMNPIHYTHPVTSFLLPMVFMFMGGIGLPGGAVYIETRLLRSRAWDTGVSLAGPAMNLVLALVLTVALRAYFIPNYPEHSVTYGMAFLLQLQISAILFNLIPVPPLDGFQAIHPWLSTDWQERLAPLWNYGLFIVVLVFWNVPAVNQAFWDTIYAITAFLGVDPALGDLGLRDFQFWKQ